MEEGLDMIKIHKQIGRNFIFMAGIALIILYFFIALMLNYF